MKKYFSVAGLVAVGVLLAVSLALRLCVMRLCGGEYIYPLDDAYIHVALAKTLAAHGVWGVQPDAAAFCSSSPLMTVILAACYVVAGVREQLPWLLSLLCNIGSLLLVDRLLLRRAVGTWIRAALLLSVACGGYFAATTAMGMEHALHAFLLVALLWALDDGDGCADRRWPWACLFAFLATAARYESLFFILPLSFGMPLAGRRRSVFVVLAALLPVIVYGCAAKAAGGMFLPNSLMLKGSFMTFPALLAKIWDVLAHAPGALASGDALHWMSVALLLTVVLPGVGRFWKVVAASVVVAVGGQYVFAMVGPRQLCRYEAYLMTIGALAVMGGAVCPQGGRRVRGVRAVACTAFLLALPGYAWVNARRIPRASEDVYSQQVQMTRLMASLPPDRRGCIALNDLGYMVLHAGCPVLDMWGLGSQDVATVRMTLLGGRYFCLQSQVEGFFRRHDVRYAVYYPVAFPDKIMPRGLCPVARLVLDDLEICGADVVDFRAVSSNDVAFLRAHLAARAKDLPPRAHLVLTPPSP